MKARPAGGQPSARLAVAVVAPVRWRSHVRGLASWLGRAAPARARGRVAIALMGDTAMRRLNGRFRGVDAPTDVLSFPASAPKRADRARATRGRRAAAARSRARHDDKTSDVSYLGDIAIAVGVARRQAARYGHALSTEVKVLALHGLLHLLGYDHDRDQGQMLRLEARLRRRVNLPAGVLARAANPGPRP
jgi:probable rRNA maturation factor